MTDSINTADEFYQRMKEEGQCERPCILCGKPTRGRGVFFPDDQLKELNVTPPVGKSAVSIYGLCDSHPATEATFTRVEEVILSERGLR